MKDAAGRFVSSVWLADGLKNYMAGLLLVSVVIGMMILVIRLLSPLFKSRYSTAFKQALWIMLALRLIVPLSYGNTFFTVTEKEYENGARAYSAGTITQRDFENTASAYVTLPEEISREEALQNDTLLQLIEGREQGTEGNFSNRMVSVHFFPYQGNGTIPVIAEEETLAQKFQYGLMQAVNFLDRHIMGIAGVYLLGVLAFLLYHFAALLFYRNRRNKVRKRVEIEEYLHILRREAERIGVKRVPALYEIEGLHSPMAAGFFRFAIYLPQGEYSQKELAAVFAHELTHIRHQDLRIKFLYLIANALHWFNPLVYLMLGEAGRDMELYCDKSVVEDYDWKERQNYNELLLQVMKNHTKGVRQEYLTTCFKGGVREMKERFLGNLDMRKKKNGMLPITAAILVIALSAGLFSIETNAVTKVGDSAVELWDAMRFQFDEEELNAAWDEAREKARRDLGGGAGDSYKAGDPAVYEARVEEYSDGLYGVPIHLNDFAGNVDVYYQGIVSEREPLENPPQVEVYCGQTAIGSYGVTRNHWQEGDKENPEMTGRSEFFDSQCAKGEENPLFYVGSWRDSQVDSIHLYFPEGQAPDAAEIEDRIYNEDGSIRYPDQTFENIFRTAEVSEKLASVSFSLAEHYAVTAYEEPLGYAQNVHPFYRGYSVKCYWANKEGWQSCTYEIVIRTQTTVYNVQQ